MNCTEELLTVNDELNNAFLRYDRYQRLRAGRAALQQETMPVVYPVQPPMYTPPPASPTHQMLPPVYSPRSQVVVVVVGCRSLGHCRPRPSIVRAQFLAHNHTLFLCVCCGTRLRCMRCVLWAVFVLFLLVFQPHCILCPQHWPSHLIDPCHDRSCHS